MAHRMFFIAAGIALVGTPATAGSSSAGEQKAKTAAAAKSDSKKYCIEYEKVVGSRISPVACKTKSEWRSEGVDVDELLRDESR
jgi:hypothetical protein